VWDSDLEVTHVRGRRWLSSVFLFLFGGALLSLATVSCGGRDSSVDGARHVVIISIDTARADHFGFMGAAEISTPSLDALAGESVVFTDCMTVVPTTLASHTTLMTGKYPHNHGTPRNGFMVSRENEMLAEVLGDAGFHTAGFVGSFALDERFDFAQGFEHYDQEFDVLVGAGGADQNQRLAENVTQAALDHLDETGVPDRLFLFAHYFDAHRPYSAPFPFEVQYDPRGRQGLLPIHDLVSTKATAPERAAREAGRHAMQYASEISYVDEHVGRLVDGLRSRGILDDALLVVTSDHGESLWEHGEEFDHGVSVYQSTMHSLCVFRLPGGESGGTRSTRPVANIDVLPTVLAFLGIPVPRGVDGEPLELRGEEAGPGAEALATRGEEQESSGDGGEPTGRARFGQATKPWRGVETDPRWANMLKSRCVRLGRYKYVQTPFLGTEELYDVVSDPSERTNLLGGVSDGALAAEYASVVAELRPRLESWAGSAVPLPSWFESSQQEETVERLKSLGYLQ
jgi:arylsulfatase A-like enzyme